MEQTVRYMYRQKKRETQRERETSVVKETDRCQDKVRERILIGAETNRCISNVTKEEQLPLRCSKNNSFILKYISSSFLPFFFHFEHFTFLFHFKLAFCIFGKVFIKVIFIPLSHHSVRNVRIFQNKRSATSAMYFHDQHDVPSLCLFHTYFHGNCSGELFTLVS